MNRTVFNCAKKLLCLTICALSLQKVMSKEGY